MLNNVVALERKELVVDIVYFLLFTRLVWNYDVIIKNFSTDLFSNIVGLLQFSARYFE